ncbi:MAG: hypothetical protein ABJH98_17990 [Reichenbachiella sp.]|uniref:hypothetical protein n=1 Tax=Reichenbachiella sp. TaxID=2184521 RepID=UPI003297E0B8
MKLYEENTKSQFETNNQFVEIDHSLIGTKICQMIAGYWTDGEIVKAYVDESGVHLLTSIEPVTWDGQTFASGSVSMRNYDCRIFGNIKYKSSGMLLTADEFKSFPGGKLAKS